MLVPKDATNDEFLLALRFLSRIWGGRYSPILCVDRKTPDPLTLFRLGESRPDFIFGVNLELENWHNSIFESSQPRGFGPLTKEYVDNLGREDDVEFITLGHVIRDIRDDPASQALNNRTLRLFSAEGNTAIESLAGAAFGIAYRRLGDDLPANKTIFESSASFHAFLEASITFVENFEQAWLDLGCHRLSTIQGYGEIPPTVVVINSPAEDLSHFWNLRLCKSHERPTWLLPVPASSLFDLHVLDGIRKWLLAFDRYQAISNFCQVTSATLPRRDLEEFATRLRETLTGTHFEFVKISEPLNRIPVTIPYESENLVTAEKRGRRIRFRSPRPELMKDELSRPWIVDLVEDDKTGRAVAELSLPPRMSTLHVLNAAGPPHIRHYRIFPISDGPESINVRVSKFDDYVDFHLPTSAEILEEIVRESGVEPIVDEKRACYVPAIKLFGGLDNAARFTSGVAGRILGVLANGPATVAEIKGKCSLGKGVLPEVGRRTDIESALKHFPEASRRVALRRFELAFERRLPKGDISSLLEFWTERGIVSRRWRIGPCHACLQSYWLPRIEIARSIICPGCGRRIRMSKGTSFGYELHPLITRALLEGLVCVVLTARYLESLTRKGFLWLAGCKFKVGEQHGDIDIVSACDGYIALAECKLREGSNASEINWDTRFAEFEQTVNVAEKCRASLVIYSSLLESYPDEFVRAVNSRVKTPMRHLLLGKEDLEQGYGRRTMETDGTTIPLRILDCVSDPMPEKLQASMEGKGEIKTPFYTSTFH